MRPLPAPLADGAPDNGRLADLLSRRAATAEGHLARALRRAARAAFLWPEEAATLLAEGRSLQELRAIGPVLARTLREWIERPPEVDEVPPVRRGFRTLAHARRVLADAPEWRSWLRGDLQSHTTWSDGANGLEEMVEAARALGYEYLAVTDHSKGLRIANGMDEERLALQGRAIARLNAAVPAGEDGFQVLRGLEMNLDPAGRGDMDPVALAPLDVVLGAFHSALRRTEDQTDRYVAAVRNPWVHVLAHPRCRVYDRRLGLRADWPRVFAEAAAQGVAVEVDSQPDRQDLDVDLLREVRRAGGLVSLGSDAHAPHELRTIELSVAAVVEAGIPRERVLNFAPAPAVRARAAERAERARSAAVPGSRSRA